MNDLQNLAIAQALFKVISGAVSTRDPDSLRSRMDAQVIETYANTGAKNFDLRLKGQKVGTYSIRFSKAVHDVELVVNDRSAFIDWCCENGLAKAQTNFTVKAPTSNMMEAERKAYDLLRASGIITEETVVHTQNFALDDAKAMFKRTGVIPDGCTVEMIDEQSEPIGTTLRVDPTLVATAMGSDLPGVVIGLLTDGGDAS